MEVGFREDDHRLRAALPRERQVALETAEVEILVHRRDDEDDVDVGAQHLLLRGLPGGLAGELRAPRKDGTDGACVLAGTGVDGDPVPDDG
jgi:hypothetical protein